MISESHQYVSQSIEIAPPKLDAQDIKEDVLTRRYELKLLIEFP